MTQVYGNVLGMLGAIVFLMLCASTAQGGLLHFGGFWWRRRSNEQAPAYSM